jgi:FkbM family methyltransferase
MPSSHLQHRRLRTGEEFACLDHRELSVLYEEIVCENVYLSHGITLPSRATVIDVGANVGLFAWNVIRHRPNAQVICIEPLPPTFQALSENIRALGLQSNVRTLNFACADRQGSATFSYYPLAAGWSTMYPHDTPEQRRLMRTNMIAHAATPTFAKWLLRIPLLGALVGRALGALQMRHRDYACALVPLSDVIASLPRVDLLKIDVERAELDVLRGISAEHWSRVRQVVVEVQSDRDCQNRAKVCELLERAGFSLHIVDIDYALPDGTPPNCVVYAQRISARSTSTPSGLERRSA